MPAKCLLPLLLLPVSGCCSLATLWCGPDRSAWVQIDDSTPTATVRTLLEAIRRDEPEVVYGTFSRAFRKAKNLDGNSALLAWNLLKANTPGLHLLGTAELPAPSLSETDRARFELSFAGHRLRIDLEREATWELRWRREDGSLGERRRPLDGSLPFTLQPLPDADLDSSRLTWSPVVFEHEGQPTVPPEQIEQVGVVRRWKVRDLVEITH